MHFGAFGVSDHRHQSKTATWPMRPVPLSPATATAIIQAPFRPLPDPFRTPLEPFHSNSWLTAVSAASVIELCFVVRGPAALEGH